MLQPIFGDIGVEAGVVHHCGKAECQKEAKSQRAQTRPKKKAYLRAEESWAFMLVHGRMIARLRESRRREIASHKRAVTHPALVELTVCRWRHTINSPSWLSQFFMTHDAPAGDACGACLTLRQC
jgi:hypothetical protein